MSLPLPTKFASHLRRACSLQCRRSTSLSTGYRLDTARYSRACCDTGRTVRNFATIIITRIYSEGDFPSQTSRCTLFLLNRAWCPRMKVIFPVGSMSCSRWRRLWLLKGETGSAWSVSPRVVRCVFSALVSQLCVRSLVLSSFLILAGSMTDYLHAFLSCVR